MSNMEDDECSHMLNHLQQYVVHLEKLIKQLKDPKKQNRELQLHKLEGLHSMITDRKKKLKLDTLRKCEDVILKILQKVNPNIVKQLTTFPEAPSTNNLMKFSCKDPPNEKELVPLFDTGNRQLEAARARLLEISTPASPSPPKDIPLLFSPIVIPTEKIKEKQPIGFRRNSLIDSEYKTEKPDIYSKAAKTLISVSNSKGAVFDRLGAKIDISKPPLSDEDLKSLVAPDRDEFNADDLSMDQLVDLRHVLTKKLHSPQSMPKQDVTDLRDKLKNREKKLAIQINNKGNEENKVVSKPRSPRVEVIIKEPDSVFGNLLSSIDDQLLGDKKKEKKDGVVTKEDKIKTTEKEQTHDKKSKHLKNKDKIVEKSDNKDVKAKSENKGVREKSENKDLKKKEHKDPRKDHKKEHRDDKNKDRKKEHKDKSRSNSKTRESDKSKHKNKEVVKVDKEKNPNSDETKSKSQENQTFKRLADKYNPRPRKNSIEELPKIVQDETRIIFDKSIAALDGIIFSKSRNVNPPIEPRRETFNFQPPADKSISFIPPQMPQIQNPHCALTNSIPTLVNYHSKYQQHNIPNHINPNQGGHSIMNNFVIQNSNTVNNHQLNNHQMNFQNAPSKAFHPYDPIDSNNAYNEYDLSKMQPVDFYSPNLAPAAQSLPSPPNYANRPQFVSRDPRLQNRMDPRKLNEDPRFDRPREDPRFSARNRDPRRRDSAGERPKFVPPKGNDPHNKYDSLYSHTDRTKPQDTFISPLDRLYSSNETASKKGNKGYGFQKFRIPKKNKEIKDKKLNDDNESRQESREEISNNDQFDDLKVNDTKTKDEKSEIDYKKFETLITEQTKVLEDKSSKIEDVTPKASSSEQNLLTNIITKVIQSSDQSKLISAILSTFEDTVNEKQKKTIKKLRRIIESDSEDDEIETNVKVDKDIKTQDEYEEKPVEKETKVVDDVPEQVKESDEETGDVSEDMSETSKEEVVIKAPRHKSRKSKFRAARNFKKQQALMKRKKAALLENPNPIAKKRTKCRSELDKLHDDIKEMFIRDGVLTASGKRVCRILKKDAESSPEEKVVQNKDAIVPVSELLDSPKRHARNSNPKVVLEKADLSKHLNLYFDSESDSETVTTRSSSRSKEKSESPPKFTFLKRNVKKPNYNEDSQNENENSSKNEDTVEEELNTSVSVSSPTTKRSIKRKRRGHNWAIGVIPKKVPKKKPSSNSTTPTPLDDDQTSIVSELEEEPSFNISDMEYVEPDKDYYVQSNTKPECKLCQFKGRMIIQHYKNVHPKHEVLISRLATNVAEEAINESIEKGFNEFEIPVNNSESKWKRKKFTYQCRFCEVFFKNETTDLFFDHLTSHTGEYRFICNFCQFKTANNKSLRSHIHSSHHSKIEQAGPITPLYAAQTDFCMIFAYICADCNFVQLNKNAIERHIKMCHLGDDKKIFKINLSMIVTKDKEVKEETIKKSTDLQEEIDDLNTTVTEDETEAKEVTSEDKEIVKKSCMDVPKIEDAQKTDATVFKVEDNLQDTTKSDDQKHEQMAEITKTILPKKRFELNLMDRIKSRLESKAPEFTPNVEETSDEPIEPSVSKNPPDLIANNLLIDVTSKTTTIQEDQFVEPKRVFAENLEKPFYSKNKEPSISILIQRLQGQLVQDGLQPPPLTPLEELDFEEIELKPEELIAKVGPLMMGTKKNHLLYVCNMKSCMFSSRSHIDFEMHCKTLHSDKYWDGFCDACQTNTGALDTMGAYTHLIQVHKSAHDIIKTEDQKPKPYLRMRRLSGDMLSEKTIEETRISSPILPPLVEYVIPPPVLNNDAVITEEEHSFPFQICNVTSLAGEEENTIENVSEPPPLQLANVSNVLLNSTFIPTAACSGTTTTIPSTIMFPLHLQTTSRGTVEIRVSPLQTKFCNSKSPTLNKSSAYLQLDTKQFLNSQKGTKKIIVKDTCMQAEEAMKPRKSEVVKKIMLGIQAIAHLYKCPDFGCDFSTNSKLQFDTHLLKHRHLAPDTLIPCLYCNYKTTYSTIGIHYDIRHSRSLYCCAYCFYRAINQSYVEIHQDHTHYGQKKKIYQVPQNQDALKSVANIPVVPKRDVVLPYQCGQLGCDGKFLIAIDFEEHLRIAHKGVPLLCYCCEHSPKSTVSAILHAQTHSIFFYHCAYCLFGASTKEMVYRHLSNTHFALPPQIIHRKFIPGVNLKETKNLDLSDDASYDYLFVDTKEDVSVFTPNAKVIISDTPRKQVPLKYTYSKTSPAEKITMYKAPTATITQIIVPKTESGNKTNEIVISDDEDESQSIDKESSIKEVAPTSPIILNKTNIIGNLNNSKDETERLVFNFIDVSSDSEVENIRVLRQTDPLEVVNSEASSKNTQSTDIVDTETIESGAENEKLNDLNKGTATDLSGINLYSCDVCKAGFLTSQAFKIHIMRCVSITSVDNLKPFKCAHCIKAFKSATGLIDHIGIHGIARFLCTLCDFKHQYKYMLRNHMKVRHKVSSISFYPQDPNKANYSDQDVFFVKPKSGKQKSSDEDSNLYHSTSADIQKGFTKTSFGPNEINQLPINPIFTSVIRCSECAFQTKVRGNLVRHLLSHLNKVPVPSSAPVNPVPCLEKNEKMFDKMTNLAHSSFHERMSTNKSAPKEKLMSITKEEEMTLPLFVPASQRYVCGANNCQYLNQEESILKQHVTAFHSYESFYKCSHCQETLSTDKGVINPEYIIKHLKLHDLTLYKCNYCKFLHHQKNKVERHVVEKHPNEKALVVVVREMEQEPGEPQSEELKEAKPWRCSMCKYRSITKDEMVSHAYNRHEVQTQYKCALCMFGSNNKSYFTSHFEDKHSGQDTHIIDAYYEVDGTFTTTKTNQEVISFDTTPLWQRNKNNFKHIRGIPIDETNKMPKKSPVKATSNLDDAIEAVANGSASTLNDPLFRSPAKKAKTLKEKKMEVNANLFEDTVESLKEPKVLSKVEKSRKFPKIKAASVSNVSVIDNANLDMLVEASTKTKNNDFDVITDDTERTENDADVSYTLQDFEEMDIVKLRDGDFRNAIGRFGKPLNNQYVCPMCNAFTTNKVNDFTFHLYKELEYARYVCTICRLRGQSLNALKRHAIKKHLNTQDPILQLSPDPEIESWLSIVLLIQRRLIFESPQTSSQTSSIDFQTEGKSEQKIFHLHKCQYCIYSSKHYSDMKKHERRHEVEKPYKCCYCSYTGVKELDIFQHSVRSHPNQEQTPVHLLTSTSTSIPNNSNNQESGPKKSNNQESGPKKSNNQESGPKKRKFTQLNESAESDAESKSSVADKSNDDAYTFDEADEETDNQIYYVCNYCPKRCNSEYEVQTHWEFTHKAKQPIFKFKKLKSDSIVKRGTLYYKCYYCDYISQVEPMKKHIKKEHVNAKFVVYRYKCGHENCNFYLKNLDSVKSHCKLQHSSTSSLYENIRKPLPTANCHCTYCNSTFETRDKLIKHHEQFHSHLEGKFPPETNSSPNDKIEEDGKRYKCPQCLQVYERYSSIRDHVRLHAKPYVCGYCPMRFSYPSAAKTHHTREHPSFEFKCENDPEGQKLYEQLRANVLILSEEGVYENARYTKSWKRMKIDESPTAETASVASTSTSNETLTSEEPPVKKFKATARKSTTQLAKVINDDVNDADDEDEGYSYYGSKPDADDISNVRAFIPFMESTIVVNISQIPFLNLFPTLEVVDIAKYPLQP